MIVIELVFASFILALSTKASATLAETSPVLLVLLSVFGPLATIRMARTISYNAVCEWLRKPFCIVVPDSSGAGDSVEPKGNSAIGKLLACPICSGTWSALVLFGLFLFVTPVGIVLIFVLGWAGASEYLHWSMERNEWAGRAAREEAGTQWMAKNSQADGIDAAWDRFNLAGYDVNTGDEL